jgi:hypothetical protein
MREQEKDIRTFERDIENKRRKEMIQANKDANEAKIREQKDRQRIKAE